MNNVLSYCGLVDARIRASDNDLPVLSVMVCFGLLLFACFSELYESTQDIYHFLLFLLNGAIFKPFG